MFNKEDFPAAENKEAMETKLTIEGEFSSSRLGSAVGDSLPSSPSLHDHLSRQVYSSAKKLLRSFGHVISSSESQLNSSSSLLTTVVDDCRSKNSRKQRQNFVSYCNCGSLPFRYSHFSPKFLKCAERSP